jgi:hypothetical protein
VVGGLAHASAQKGVVLEWCKHDDIVAEAAAHLDGLFAAVASCIFHIA